MDEVGTFGLVWLAQDTFTENTLEKDLDWH
jgi:hypothetical protein